MSRYIDAIPFAQAVSDLRNKEREEYDNLVGKHRSLARSIHGQHVEFCEKMLKAIREQPTVDAVPVPDGGIGELSDGYHTFNGLYYQRMMLFAALVKTYKDRAWKSRRHSDGKPCFGGGWFIVGIDTPQGGFTYHYEDKYFDLFDCVELPNGKEWDGHTEDDVTRLLTLDAVPIPCKLGDTVYYCRFDKKGYGWITPCIVTGIHITCARNRSGQQEDYLVVKIPPCMLSAHLRIKELGTRLFLTKEEANEKIKATERKDNGQ